ncbi:hypothetical protein AV530_013478 [Patagioenas fasciata monilis]|uniref:Gastric intrinsic factor n=1 Tax=Patagioenas fasciata monilis TaxID=372326 RepID=A0A1V4JPM4_PATFA|nr:hypothetical protein AV530_013478 [Patagioenas fasciata monilis]
MRMLSVAFGIGVLLALAGSTAAKGCNASQELVSKLVQRMEHPAKGSETPNPSILLALNLVRDTGNYTKQLLQKIKEEAVKRAQEDMTSGKVALYVLSLLSSCQDPRHVRAFGKTIDLVQILQQKTDEEVAKLITDGIPITTLYSVSLDALALCLARAGGYRVASVVLAKQVLRLGDQLLVDTRAMAALAMTCTYRQTDLQDVRELLWRALHNVTNGFLDEQEKNDGMIGNIYSMGLALQALESTQEFYAPRKWNSAQACDVVFKHDYNQSMAIAQVLPALVGKTYLDAADLNCTTDITVNYTITNMLQGRYFEHNISVNVPAGSVLLKVLETAQKEKPDIFR